MILWIGLAMAIDPGSVDRVGQHLPTHGAHVVLSPGVYDVSTARRDGAVQTGKVLVTGARGQHKETWILGPEYVAPSLDNPDVVTVLTRQSEWPMLEHTLDHSDFLSEFAETCSLAVDCEASEWRVASWDDGLVSDSTFRATFTQVRSDLDQLRQIGHIPVGGIHYGPGNWDTDGWGDGGRSLIRPPQGPHLGFVTVNAPVADSSAWDGHRWSEGWVALQAAPYPREGEMIVFIVQPHQTRQLVLDALKEPEARAAIWSYSYESLP